MGLGESWYPFRGGGMREARPSRMVIPPGWFLLALFVTAVVTMGVWL